MNLPNIERTFLYSLLNILRKGVKIITNTNKISEIILFNNLNTNLKNKNIGIKMIVTITRPINRKTGWKRDSYKKIPDI
ncbi:hypothetical protein MTP04_00680 [Lysinibacillus sp. PLM2]|nr:hypothetical protein MTP04_00680 [Lysinibacillus sp. PLM2]